jgi:hypothetical protein
MPNIDFDHILQAGMLREALKGLEKIGEKKKIVECIEMIRALGQSITLH